MVRGLGDDDSRSIRLQTPWTRLRTPIPTFRAGEGGHLEGEVGFLREGSLTHGRGAERGCRPSPTPGTAGQEIGSFTRPPRPPRLLCSHNISCMVLRFGRNVLGINGWV